MLLDLDLEDTICALSTPSGEGGIAIIRVCGPRALSIVQRHCPRLRSDPTSHTVHYVDFLSSTNAAIIDDVLVSFFKSGSSYTGDETLEISCHGGIIPCQLIISELLKSGCRPAERGEFTYRAFSNGRIDLVQAENVLELIGSQSATLAHRASKNIHGELSRIYQTLEDDMIWSLAQLEAIIDFSTEDIQFAEYSTLATHLTKLLETVKYLLKSYSYGKVLKDGFHVAIVGEPNAGKSSLLNTLMGEEKAIVTEYAGTTRDVIEGSVLWNGLSIKFFDTAGLREATDPVEKIGIVRTHDVIKKVDLVIWVIDSCQFDLNSHVAPFIAAQAPVVKFFNKVDKLPSTYDRTVFSRQTSTSNAEKESDVCFGHTQSIDGIDQIKNYIQNLTSSQALLENVVVTQSRHIYLLELVKSGVEKAIDLLASSESPDFVAFELQDSIRAVHEILGKEFHEQVIDRVFKEFCLGK